MSRSRVDRFADVLFGRRRWFLAAFALLTALFGYHLTGLHIELE